MDVKMAFLRGYLEEDIYMSQSQGFIEASKGNLVCRLNSLYRLQQSPRQWYKHFDTYMLQIWYRRCDCCVYSYVFKDGKIILLLLYVDDMLIACQDMSKVRQLKSLLGKELDMKDLGPAAKDPRNGDKERPKFGQVVAVIRQIEVELLGATRTISKRFEEVLGVNDFHEVFKARQGGDCWSWLA
ncbi:Hypothetical predicted protein [Prunus dulcis]|uniref:Reverse transcriptase Ty1/copia-type domain-containing protein n=1 Tax=Prunus dulcis TaxID=3755 RepID=A0A5E4EKA3_PRUDU|nr:Hypothetical predicted protein [Prunus dulcis]